MFAGQSEQLREVSLAARAAPPAPDSIRGCPICCWTASALLISEGRAAADTRTAQGASTHSRPKRCRLRRACQWVDPSTVAAAGTLWDFETLTHHDSSVGGRPQCRRAHAVMFHAQRATFTWWPRPGDSAAASALAAEVGRPDRLDRSQTAADGSRRCSKPLTGDEPQSSDIHPGKNRPREQPADEGLDPGRTVGEAILSTDWRATNRHDPGRRQASRRDRTDASQGLGAARNSSRRPRRTGEPLWRATLSSGSTKIVSAMARAIGAGVSLRAARRWSATARPRKRTIERRSNASAGPRYGPSSPVRTCSTASGYAARTAASTPGTNCTAPTTCSPTSGCSRLLNVPSASCGRRARPCASEVRETRDDLTPQEELSPVSPSRDEPTRRSAPSCI